MKIMPCPLNGPRNIAEFQYGGAVRPRAAAQEPWGETIFFEEGGARVVLEWWCHIATNYWFIAERDVAEDRVLRTFPAAELPP